MAQGCTKHQCSALLRGSAPMNTCPRPWDLIPTPYTRSYSARTAHEAQDTVACHFHLFLTLEPLFRGL